MITQAGALGDPFGSGLRTVWWVYGVGPVKIVFQHTGGESALRAAAVDEPGAAAAARATRTCCRWRSATVAASAGATTKHMKRWSEQRFEVAAVANNTARVNVHDTSGPIDVNAVLRVLEPARRARPTITSVLRRARDRARELPQLGPNDGPAGPRALRHAAMT